MKLDYYSNSNLKKGRTSKTEEEPQSWLDKITAWTEKYLVPPLGRFAANKWVVAIQSGMAAIMPLLIVGSFTLIIAYPPIPEWAVAVEPYLDLILMPYNMTMGIISVYVAFGIGYALARAYNVNPLAGGIIAEVAFLYVAAPGMTTTYLGDWGLFTALIIPLLAVEVYRVCMQRELYIKMPEGVPPMITAAFAALVPMTIVLGICFVVRTLLDIDVPGLTLVAFMPLVPAVDSPYGVFMAGFLNALFWSVGLHGGLIVGAMLEPLLTFNLAENAAAVVAGVSKYNLPHVFAGLLGTLCVPGGTGATLGPTIFLWCRSKSKRLRTVGRLGLIPGIFNINEPVTFGTPIIMNPIMWIPLYISNFANGFIGWFLIKLRLMAGTYIYAPWTAPAPLLAFLITGGDIPAIIFSLFCIGFPVLIYYPFFKIWEKHCLEEEVKAPPEEAK